MPERAFPSLKHHFLVSLPSLSEGIFAHSLCYLCEHDEQGSMGLIVNHPLDMDVSEILEQLELDNRAAIPEEAIYAGGPVHTDRGFVLHRRDTQSWEASLLVNNDMAVTTSLDILEAIAEQRGPKEHLIALGYAGWGPGQLEEELTDNAWLSLPADPKILFEIPAEERIDAALATLGINFAQLGSDSGHA